jgi:DNA-binding transcriptional regulator PaaX
MVDYQFKKDFEKLLGEYHQVATSKKFLRSLVRFEDMYRGPRGRLGFYNAIFGDPFGYAERAKIKRAAVYNTRKDLVTTVDKKGRKNLILTSKGHKVFFKNYPLWKLRQKKWDGNWTLVSYDIPSSPQGNVSRNKLNRKLKKFGFGQFQQSMLVSPLPLEEPAREFIRGERLEEHVLVMVSRRILGLSDKEIAKRAYGLHKVNALYQELNDKYDAAKSSSAALKRWLAYYLAVDYADPQLPEELLPDGWLGAACGKKFSSSFNLYQ